MRIGGFQKRSLIDYPGKTAAVIKTQGCPWRCPFCHNRSLVYPARFQPAIPVEEVIEHLGAERNELEGVVITGGEPTLQTGLVFFLERVRSMDLLIKLDTNGSHPEVLSALLGAKLLDYVAMDIKGPLCDYARFTGCAVDTGLIELSIELIKQSGLPYEFRTTLVGGLHERAHIEELAPVMYGVRRYALQSYRPPPADAKNHDPFSAPDADLIRVASEALRDKVDEFVIR
jgi:pyruvate formate lyase activating enzyme